MLFLRTFNRHDELRRSSARFDWSVYLLKKSFGKGVLTDAESEA